MTSCYKLDLSLEKINSAGVWMFMHERDESNDVLLIFIMKYVNLRGALNSPELTPTNLRSICILHTISNTVVKIMYSQLTAARKMRKA